MIDSEWEGKGMMQIAMRSAFRWGREEFGLRRVRLLIAPSNERSLRLARALGFRQENREGRPFRKGSQWENVLDYYVLTLE